MISRVASEFITEFIESGKTDWLDVLLEKAKPLSLRQNGIDPIEAAISSQSEDMVAYIFRREEGHAPHARRDGFVPFIPRDIKCFPSFLV